ncbi:MAG: hypothetical protein GXW99_11565 [Clostridiales bacterium]|nr:hypothetical protein [Clostridiales bacterium]
MADKGKRRTEQEMIAELDSKIAFHQNKIALLESKKALLTDRESIKAKKKLLDNAIKTMSFDEIKKKLGLS